MTNIADRLRALDMVFHGHSLKFAKEFLGIAEPGGYDTWLFQDVEVRAETHRRIAAGKHLPRVAQKALDRYIDHHPEPLLTEDLRAKLLGLVTELKADNVVLHADIVALREDVRELGRRVELAIPAEEVIDAARNMVGKHCGTMGGRLLHAALGALGRDYNPYNLNSVRRLLRGFRHAA